MASERLVRPIGDDEVTFYAANGWAKLDRFIEPDFARELLAAARKLMGPSGLDHKPRPGIDVDFDWYLEYQYPGGRDRIEPFASLAHAPSIGEAAARLMRRKIGVRYWRDQLACRQPDAMTKRSSATPPHQDFAGRMFDRVGTVNFWIALNDVPPERGSMRFYSKSHLEGPLGLRYVDGKLLDILSLYPEIADRCPLSPPLHLKPGDATCHHMLTLHTSPVNRTGEQRWSLINLYFPEDAIFVGTEPYELVIRPGQRFDHPNFPVIWTPSGQP